MKRLFWLVSIALVVMAIISSWDISNSFGEVLFIVGLASGAPLILAGIFSGLKPDQTAMQYVTAASFTAVSAVGLYFLSLASLQVLTSGPLNESGMLFTFLPFLYIKFAVTGALIGGIAFLAVWLFGKYA
ncbi:hypothetical protein LHL20_20685 [Alteromonas sp. McT4-15]|uniref:hypothetical protein n=1 Tax=Alteromonas sp. McT4-15 TaxID=2881256 RepID=UPI001CF8FBDB|nr:hypothetical protein [Alteromonas sp. McT4-15]MCB4438640.1 hypothetical protein [Alteromonas sp. McT4-15]